MRASVKCEGARWTIAAIAAALIFFVSRGADDSAQNDEAAPATGVEDLLEAGRQLWDEYAPDEVKANYELPTTEELEGFLTAVQRALTEGSWDELSGYEIEARSVSLVLRQFEGGDELADWLEPRLDFLKAAGELQAVPKTPVISSVPAAKSPLNRPYWDQVTVGRNPPARADALVPRLKAVFTDEGVPPAWVWMAEVESSMNPKARSPAGARGLFQLMPATAERFGMRTSWPDQRTDPEKSARAAAQYLRFLYGHFGSWPLALAAYNAGEGRLDRALKNAGANSFSGVAPHLPAETQLYVPKVMATVAVRESLGDPATLPAPSR